MIVAGEFLTDARKVGQRLPRFRGDNPAHRAVEPLREFFLIKLGDLRGIESYRAP